jgi:tetratricopeptide (TPR) repeat protein
MTPAARLNLATVLADRGRIYEAERAYRDAVAADPGSILARRGLFDLLAAAGRTEDALAAGRELLALEEVSPESWQVVARLWAGTGRLGEARAWLAEQETAAGVGPLLAEAILDEAAGDAEGAGLALAAALDADPGSWEVAEALFRFHEQRGDLAAAVPFLRRGLAARGGDSLPHLIALGYIALQAGRLEDAGDFLGRALEMAPQQEEVLLYMGSVHFRSGRYRESARLLTRLVQQAPFHEEGRANLILALARSGRVAQALDAFRAAGPGGRDSVRLLNAAAYACLLNNLADEGLPLVERSLQLEPDSREARELAAALRQQAARSGP